MDVSTTFYLRITAMKRFQVFPPLMVCSDGQYESYLNIRSQIMISWRTGSKQKKKGTVNAICSFFWLSLHSHYNNNQTQMVQVVLPAP